MQAKLSVVALSVAAAFALSACGQKEEPKPAEADMKPTPAPAPKPAEEKKTSPADLRTMCAAYCQRVPDGKARIKQWLTDKGYKKVSDIPEADLPEFKALVSA